MASFFSIVSKPKSVLLLPIQEVKELTRRPYDKKRLVKNSEAIIQNAYFHFSGDEIELMQLNGEISKGNFVTYPKLNESVMKRLRIMSTEVRSYKEFADYVSPLSNSSDKLKGLVYSTNLLTDIMKQDIENILKSLNRSVY